MGLVVGGVTAGGAALASTTPPPSGPAEPAVAGEFAIPSDQLAALEEAGLGHLVGTEYPGQPEGVPWPTEAWPLGHMPDGVDVAALQGVLDTAFAPGSGVDAAVVIQGGRLVLQQYRDGVDPAEPHISWSMAKSITQSMIGILVDEGRLDLWGPAPVDEWSNSDDPRHPITIDEMLHMRSGLQWNEEYEGTSDVTEMLFTAGKDDRAAYAAAKPLEFEPDTVWEYSTGTSMMLSRIIANEVGYGADGTDWAQSELFGPIGVSNVEYSLDTSGVMSGGSGINMSAQDFARFGYLYLRGGTWDGEQIVPQAWVDYARLPYAADPLALSYGAHWWVNGTDERWADRFPTMFSAQGFNGQFIYVVPELDAVFVVLSNDVTDLPDRTVAGLIEAFAGVAP